MILLHDNARLHTTLVTFNEKLSTYKLRITLTTTYFDRSSITKNFRTEALENWMANDTTLIKMCSKITIDCNVEKTKTFSLGLIFGETPIGSNDKRLQVKYIHRLCSPSYANACFRFYLVEGIVGRNIVKFQRDRDRGRMIVQIDERIIADDKVFLGQKLLKH